MGACKANHRRWRIIDEHELHITYKIVEAAIWYTLAERVELGSLSK